jgi:subtilisin-like proprotein convertase family protein
VTRLEHVQVHVKLSHQRRGDITMVLTSPSGTRSTILKPRPLDSASSGINFDFLTVHNWLEDPTGEWTLEVSDVGSGMKRQASRGQLEEWSLTLWGTDDQLDGSTKQTVAHSAEQGELSEVMNIEENLSNSLQINYHKERGENLDQLIRYLERKVKKQRDDHKRTLKKEQQEDNANHQLQMAIRQLEDILNRVHA